eukprot:gnl/TRDRNA2_/TRDRNA2_198402_c0_seq1.p1 gnl/TRDRNA2_/TRDRNA2_198402_c0~~gnl/TRDRNA2_/TRDRNA2_198402_c0_seq1.p1  ORF type:complete len:204 (-),score=35.23 gnl/TRDRNA2_/TRDRNA2_198402_c0_seq1:90-701(-)
MGYSGKSATLSSFALLCGIVLLTVANHSANAESKKESRARRERLKASADDFEERYERWMETKDFKKFESDAEGKKQRLTLTCSFCHLVVLSVRDYPNHFTLDEAKEILLERCSKLEAMLAAIPGIDIPLLAAEKLYRGIVSGHTKPTINAKARGSNLTSHNLCTSSCPPRTPTFDEQLARVVTAFKDASRADNADDWPAHDEM